MKTLLLLRHAKAENGAPGFADLDRALNERGRQEARALGEFLKQQNIKLGLVLCSPAGRARETAELVLAAAEAIVDCRSDPRIYEANPEQLMQVISEVDEGVMAVLLVGHNPGMEELLRVLAGRAEQMTPCTVAKIEVDAEGWFGATESNARLDWIVRPKELVDG